MFSGQSSKIQDKFLDFIGAELILDHPPPISRKAILLDPDIGIGHKKTKRHITIQNFAKFADSYLIVFSFDQSFGFNENHMEVMANKLKELKNLGVVGFYYNSHAKFLFGSKSKNELNIVKEYLKGTGLPSSRLIDFGQHY